MTPQSSVDEKAAKAHHLDEATQSVIDELKLTNKRFRIAAYTSLTLVLIVGIVGIYYQNYIANQNKQHIDCIVKLFVTPLPPNANHKVIDNPSGECNIRFTQ